MSINIEVLLDKLEENEIREDIFNIFEEELNNEPISEKVELEINKPTLEDTPVFEHPLINHPELKPFNIEELETKTIIDQDYNTYKVIIINEGDSIETVVNNYNTTREKLELYNNIEIINVGDKIIIPTND